MAIELIGETQDLPKVVNAANMNFLDLKGKETTQIFKDDTGTRRVLLGKGKDGFYGLKVSEPGVDVFDADDNDLYFNSSQNTFKIVATGTLDVTCNSATTQGTASVAHGLGYIPAYDAYISSGLDYFKTPWTLFGVATADLVTYDLYVTETDVVGRITVKNPGLTHQATFKYYLLQETAN